MAQAQAQARAADHREELGGRIRRLRLARGLTQQELAGDRYSRGFVAAVESGARTPSGEALRHLAERLRVDVDDLRYGRPAGTAQRLAEALAAARRGLARGDVEPVAAELGRIADEAARYGLAELRCWAVYLLGEVAVHRGEHAVAERHFDRAADLLPEVTAPEPAPRSTPEPAPGSRAGATPESAPESAPEPAPESAPGSAPELAAAVTARRAYCRFVAGESDRAVAMIEDHLRALRAQPAPSPDAALRLLMSLIYIFLELDWRDRARRLEAEATALLPRVRRRDWMAQFFSVTSQLHQGDAELAEAERLLGAAREIFEELGLARDLAACHWAHGYVLRRAGRLTEAAAAFERARAGLAGVGAKQDHAGVTLELAEARRRAGRLADARALAEEGGAICAASRHLEGMAEADRILGLVALDSADHEAAERLLRRAVDRYERAGLMRDVVGTCRVLGKLLLDRGRPAEAAAVLRRGLSCAEALQ